MQEQFNHFLKTVNTQKKKAVPFLINSDFIARLKPRAWARRESDEFLRV